MDYLYPRLFEPLGIDRPEWETVPRGINTGGWGLHLTTEDIAKFGVSFCDLSSSLELDTQIGYKDHQKIKKFIEKVNELKN